MIEVLGVPIYDRTIPEAVELVLSICEESRRNNHLVSATGAHGLVLAKKQVSFAEVLRSFFLNLPDGMPTVWVGRIKGASQMQRCYGPAFFEAFMRRSANTSVRHFLCGGKEGVAAELQVVCRERFLNSQCVGVFSPPFRSMDRSELVSLGGMIRESRADIVWIGMSTPKQELFAKTLATYIETKFIVTVGAAFDFHTGHVRQAPPWMQAAGLEWFFRLLVEPKRLFRRYFEIVPLFLYFGVKDVWMFHRNNREQA